MAVYQDQRVASPLWLIVVVGHCMRIMQVRYKRGFPNWQVRIASDDTTGTTVAVCSPP